MHPSESANHSLPTTNLTPPYPAGLRGALIVLGAVILAAWLLATPGGVLGKADAVGYAICHRIEARTFHAHDRPLPLCARCTGIYLGVVAGLGWAAWRGRLRGARLPSVRVVVAMVAVGAFYAFDGLNSYLSLFEFYRPVYTPHNTLRLFTGMTFGVALITLVLPVWNSMVWRAPGQSTPVANLRELALLYGVGALVAGAVLLPVDALRVVLGLLSALSVVLMFMVIGSVSFLMLLRRENSVRGWPDLALPGWAGLVFALALIGIIDAARYWATGTWDGFTF